MNVSAHAHIVCFVSFGHEVLMARITGGFSVGSGFRSM